MNRRTTDSTLDKKGQKDKQWSTKHYTENWATPILLWKFWTQVVHKCYPSCYSY